MPILNKDQEQSLEYFKECIKKDNVYEEELTLFSMKNVLEIIEMYKRENELLLKTIDKLKREEK